MERHDGVQIYDPGKGNPNKWKATRRRDMAMLDEARLALGPIWTIKSRNHPELVRFDEQHKLSRAAASIP